MSVTLRKIVSIDREKCTGCGVCVDACHEGAIRMADGKAELVSDSYCDGLGDCLAPCPAGAISIVEREAAAYDEAAVAERMRARRSPAGDGAAGALECGCPGTLAKALKAASAPCGGDAGASSRSAASELMNWPVQLRLVPPSAPYLRGADLLLAADCVPVAAADFHRRFLKNRPVVIACPKLDDTAPHIEKLAAVLKAARPASLTVARMEVPCCGGLVRVAEQAIAAAGTGTELRTVVVGIDGRGEG